MTHSSVILYMSVVLSIGALGCRTSETVGGKDCSDPHSAECEAIAVPTCSIPTPHLLLQFSEPGALIRTGGIVVLGETWVVAGAEENTLAPVEEVDRLTQPRVVLMTHDGTRALPLPQSAIASPVPILLGEDRWGLIWATVDPPAGYAERWIEGWYTDLWWAEWSPHGWSEPAHVIRADFGLQWDENRALRFTPDGSVYLMVTGRDEDFRRRLFFGEIRTGVKPLALGADIPLSGSFVLRSEKNGRVFYTVRNEQTRIVDFKEASLNVSAGVAGSPKTIGRVPLAAVGGTIQAIQDVTGRVILVWNSQDLTRLHGFSELGSGKWRRDDPGEPVGLLFDWVAGRGSNCGRVEIYAMVLDAEGEFRLHVSRWKDTWGVFALDYPSQIAIYPLEGVAADGSWVVGWNGTGRTDTPHYGFWALEP